MDKIILKIYISFNIIIISSVAIESLLYITKVYTMVAWLVVTALMLLYLVWSYPSEKKY